MDHHHNDAAAAASSKVAVSREGVRPAEGRRVSWANTAHVKTLAYVHETRQHRINRILAQVLAASVKNLMLLDLGMIIGFPTILIPAIHNAKHGLALNDEETSWIGSITMICQPVGSLLSGVILEGLGRKHAMMLINVPLLAGWLLIYWASSPGLLYAAFSLLGLCVGFMEAPTLTYIAEICEPRLRGVLTSYSETCVTLGILVEYLLGSSTHWQTAAAVSAGLPVLTLLALTRVPETPMWLLSRGRRSEAEASLRWLRGWTSTEAVRGELAALSAYAQRVAALDQTPPPPPRRRPSSATGTGAGGDVMTPEEERAAALASLHERHRGSQNFPVGLPSSVARPPPADGSSSSDEEDCCQLPLCRRTAAVLQGATLRPLLVVTVYFLLQHWSGVSGLRPYMVEVCAKLGVPGDPHWDTVVIGASTLLGFIVCILTMKRLGKRLLSLISFGTTALTFLLLGWYTTAASAATSSGEEPPVGAWAPLTLLLLNVFFSALGISPIPWILLSEVFPFRTRGLASGLVAALSYVFGFSASKTFFDLEAGIGLAGMFFLYGAVGLVGFAFIYFFLIETEGRSLEDIETDYSGGRKSSLPAAAPSSQDGVIPRQQPAASVVRRSVIKNANNHQQHHNTAAAGGGLDNHSADVKDLGNRSNGNCAGADAQNQETNHSGEVNGVGHHSIGNGVGNDTENQEPNLSADTKDLGNHSNGKDVAKDSQNLGTNHSSEVKGLGNHSNGNGVEKDSESPETDRSAEVEGLRNDPNENDVGKDCQSLETSHSAAEKASVDTSEGKHDADPGTNRSAEVEGQVNAGPDDGGVQRRSADAAGEEAATRTRKDDDDDVTGSCGDCTKV